MRSKGSGPIPAKNIEFKIQGGKSANSQNPLRETSYVVSYNYESTGETIGPEIVDCCSMLLAEIDPLGSALRQCCSDVNAGATQVALQRAGEACQQGEDFSRIRP
jgi:hypothetical protein